MLRDRERSAVNLVDEVEDGTPLKDGVAGQVSRGAEAARARIVGDRGRRARSACDRDARPRQHKDLVIKSVSSQQQAPPWPGTDAGRARTRHGRDPRGRHDAGRHEETRGGHDLSERPCVEKPVDGRDGRARVPSGDRDRWQVMPLASPSETLDERGGPPSDHH